MFYEMLQPTTYAELKRELVKIARGQSPTHTGREIAEGIADQVTAVALNNRATWKQGKSDDYYKRIATEIDDDESTWRAAATGYDETTDWEIDCGLMASLVHEHGCGNCDDLASFALNYGMMNFPECVLCFTQHDGFAHSFVLVYCQGESEVWLADTWVERDRAIAFSASYWFDRYNLNCRVMPVKVSRAGSGVMVEWDTHATTRPHKKRRIDYQYPRTRQVGAYTHHSAAHAESGGLGD